MVEVAGAACLPKKLHPDVGMHMQMTVKNMRHVLPIHEQFIEQVPLKEFIGFLWLSFNSCVSFEQLLQCLYQ